MRKVKASNVRIGQYVSQTHPSNPHGYRGWVQSIVHLTADLFDLSLDNGERVTLAFDDTLYRS